MVKKAKNRKSTKMPEQSISDKINHHKGVNRTLRKRLDNLEKRMIILEERLSKYKKLIPDEPINWGTPKKPTEEDVRKAFLEKFHPDHGDKNE